MDGFVLSLEFSEEEFPPLLDISSLFYDLELAHDFGALISDREYQNYNFDRFFWYRNGRPVPQWNRIKTARISKASPLILEVVVPSLGALWILIQIIEKVADRPLLREKLEREVAKLRADEIIRRASAADLHVEFMERLNRDDSARHVLDHIEQRLRSNSIKIVNADLNRFTASSNDSEYED